MVSVPCRGVGLHAVELFDTMSWALASPAAGLCFPKQAFFFVATYRPVFLGVLDL